ncbi:hypothetical protein KVR01_008273 [Diaporthe batatas]|uniref:uncharacterized protein n=1 Tax=Diaporthe batatas TaxID=748121 RepID=UPI001D042AA0|nr:uncharacterized protein KVR01_008273 [Diaporthe batatas]KAG8162508.1 hypothetical protein KVR01_008273 [Diaporthe batatas]
MSQTTIINPNTVGGMCAQTSPSASGEGHYLILRGDDSANKQINPDTSQDGPLKASFKKALTKTRKQMAHVWQSVKALFNKALTKTRNQMARIFSVQNVEKAVTFYEEKGNDVGAACKTAGCNIYKRAAIPSKSVTNQRSTADTITAPGGKRSTKSRVAKKAKIAVCTVVNAVRIGCASAKLGLDAALGVFEAAGAVVLYALDQFDDEE